MDDHASGSDSDDVDVLDIEPRSPDAIADRVLVLSALMRRLVLESEGRHPAPMGDDSDDSSTTDEDLFDLQTWLRETGLLGQATPFERSLLDAPIGALDPEAMDAASWSGEAALMLAWTLGLVSPLPGWDTESNANLIFGVVPNPEDDPVSWRRTLSVRMLDALAEARELAELWHWRTGVELVRRDAPAPERRELLAIVRETAAEALAIGLLSTLVEGDFAYRAATFSTIDGSTLDDLANRATERLRAMNWVCGFGDDWESVPLELDSEEDA